MASPAVSAPDARSSAKSALAKSTPARTSRVDTRKRKAHTKSRGGCGNCKIRRVKCDEDKPHCRRCKDFGVSCTYDRISSELQPFEEAAFMVNSPLTTTVSLNQTVLGMLNEHLRQESGGRLPCEMDNYDLELLNRFHERTILTIGLESTRPVYQREGLRLAIRHPFLMHTALTLTMMHDRANLPNSKQSMRELYHWCEGASQFNKKLTSPLTSSERDALWIASTLLGANTLAHVEADDPEQSWPLKDPSPTDLDWLKMASGKKEAWRIADLNRPDSALRSLVMDRAMDDFMIKTTDYEAFSALPPEMIEFCGLLPNSTPETNPYHINGSVLGRLMTVDDSAENIMKYMTFMSYMPTKFRNLLDARDPRAVMLMLWYHTRVGVRARWWSKKRTWVESGAMILYLERFHGYTAHVRELLEYPKAARRARYAEVVAVPRRLIHPAPHIKLIENADSTSEQREKIRSWTDYI